MINPEIYKSVFDGMFIDLGVDDLPEEIKSGLREKMQTSLEKSIVAHIASRLPDYEEAQIKEMSDDDLVALLAENDIDVAEIAIYEAASLREDLKSTVDYAQGYLDGKTSDQ